MTSKTPETTSHKFRSFSQKPSIFPDATYASQPAQLEIFRSGGKGESYVSTVFEDQIGGKLEYFIEDLDIQAIVVPNTKTRLTNATNISFTVEG